MKERPFQFKNYKQEEEVLPRPPAWCGAICRNAMNEICMEQCAIERDCSGFEEKPNLRLADMPRFPKTEGMTKEERFTSVTVYLAKIVDHLQGVDEDASIYPPVRGVVYSALGGMFSNSVSGESDLPKETSTRSEKVKE